MRKRETETEIERERRGKGTCTEWQMAMMEKLLHSLCPWLSRSTINGRKSEILWQANRGREVTQLPLAYQRSQPAQHKELK